MDIYISLQYYFATYLTLLQWHIDHLLSLTTSNYFLYMKKNFYHMITIALTNHFNHLTNHFMQTSNTAIESTHLWSFFLIRLIVIIGKYFVPLKFNTVILKPASEHRNQPSFPHVLYAHVFNSSPNMAGWKAKWHL